MLDFLNSYHWAPPVVGVLVVYLLACGVARIVGWLDDRAYYRQLREDEQRRLLAEARELAEAHRAAEDCQ